jgi:hypothetical protein
MIEDLIWLAVAISRQMTLLELRNVWNYKHCLVVRTDEDREGRNYFEIKYYSLWTQIKNICLFLSGKDVISGGKAKRGVKVVKSNGEYEDLSLTAR